MAEPIINLRKAKPYQVKSPLLSLPPTKEHLPKQPEDSTDRVPTSTSEFNLAWQSAISHSPKTLKLITVSASLVGLGIAILYDALLGIFIALAGGVFFLYARAYPKAFQVQVGGAGVSVNNTLYPYRDMRSFWIDYNPGGYKELSIELRRWHLPYLKIPLSSTNPLEVRARLIEMVAEKEHEQSLVTVILRRLGL